MIVRQLYYLLFYKLFRLGILSRKKADSSLYSAIVIGAFSVLWLTYFLAVFDYDENIPGLIFGPILFLSVAGNILFIMRKKKYEQIINTMESKKLPLFYHITVYLLLAWTFVGALFL